MPEIQLRKPEEKAAVSELLKGTPKRVSNELNEVKHNLAQTCVDTGVKMAEAYAKKSNDPAFRKSDIAKLFLV